MLLLCLCRWTEGSRRLTPWGLTVLFDESEDDEDVEDVEDSDDLEEPVYGLNSLSLWCDFVWTNARW